MMTRASRRITLGATLGLVAGCTTDRPAPTALLRAPVFDRQQAGDMGGHETQHLATDLQGRNEVPPRDTPASGEARFRVNDDGSVSYKVFVEGLVNPFMSHIHVGPPGVSGPIVVWLFPSTAPVPGPAGSGLHNGLLAAGTFTASDLVGPLKGHPLAELLDSISAGRAYVNVHTLSGVPPVNSGPGNFPGGEIRGQLGSQAEREGQDQD